MIENADRGPLDPHVRTVLGRQLADRRKLAGLTGSEVARRVRMSQSRISRIENGLAPVTVDELASVAVALGLSHAEFDRLLAPVVQGGDAWTRKRLSADDLAERQAEILHIEATTKHLRVFTPSAVAGLLQTSEYARALLATLHELHPGDGGDDVVLRSVSARLERQHVLADDERRFHFVMQEAALESRLCPPTQMLAQIQRIRDVLERRANVTLAVLLHGSQWPQAAANFTVYDDSHVLIDLPHSSMLLNSPDDVVLYRRLFDTLEEHATRDVGPILDRYVDMYYDLARPRRD
ncbi:helix-turn-helix transcriptional regulator [Virgisporangium ochraceum]|jgi:transcriptional regulator with XRE-family HTH domain|uniref:Transcriptional regulator n=1 Tax=Virgisporangium ochraceum TaxID=65505 RepID=A0A8J3ZM78_9ACTN|nr:helix-turn-helix transcriptional regulator [Virgisporangium ochraceum]GIJ66889.1 transcriptional regulator [Virgisporangium ochraceum]